MNWQEEMRMGLKLIKDACDRVSDGCEKCPIRSICDRMEVIPIELKFDDNGDEI